MGGSGSKPTSASSLKENAELDNNTNNNNDDNNNNKASSKDDRLPTPFIIENVNLTPEPTPRSRRRRFSSKKAAAAAKDKSRGDAAIDDDAVNNPKTAETTVTSSQDVDNDAVTRGPHSSKSPRDPGKIGTLVRERVTNISKTLKDWTMISSKGSRSANPVILRDRKRSPSPTVASSPQRKNTAANNQFNFHHATYLAQTKQEGKNSSVDFSAPRHLGPARKISSHDYASPSKPRDVTRKSGYSTQQQPRSHQQSPDHIPAPRKYANKKDSKYNNNNNNKTSNNNSRQTSPSYLYSLELKQRSSDLLAAETSAMYATNPSREKKKSPERVPTTYLASDATFVMPNRDSLQQHTAGKNSSSEFVSDIGESVSMRYIDPYCGSIEKEALPMFLPGVKQEMVVQRVEVKSDLDFAAMKPETIRVNGIEFVRKKSNHPHMKRLLTVDKEQHVKTVTVLNEKPERDQSPKRASKDEKTNVNVAGESRLKNHEEKEMRVTFERAQRKTTEKDADKRETNKKSKPHDREVETKEVGKLVVDNKPRSDMKYSGPTNDTTTKTDNRTRKGVITKENDKKTTTTDAAARSLRRAEVPIKIVEKKQLRRESKGEDVRGSEKKETTNSGEIKGDTRKEANNRGVEKNPNDAVVVSRRHDGRAVEMKNLTKADREIIKQCRIRHMPIAVSSHGRIFLPSAKFMATPLAVMRESAMKVSSEKSYCRIPANERVSPNRLRRASPPSPNRGGPAQLRADQPAKERGARKPSSEHQKTSTRVHESKENENVDNNLVKRSSNKSPNRSPRSTSPVRKQKSAEGQSGSKAQAGTKPSPNVSREKASTVSGKETTATTQHTSVQRKDEEKSNRNADIRCKSSPNQSKQSARQGDESSSSTGNSNSSSREMVKCKSEKSVDVWFSRSVRSKNKIFETIIERTASASEQQQQQQQAHRRASRRSSPQSQVSETPFSKAIKLKYRAISAKRIASLGKVPPPPSPPSTTTTAAAPQVFTPWDSCMMFKPKHVRPRSRSPARTQRHSSPETAERKFPNETCQAMRTLHHETMPRQQQLMTECCSCDLESCHCIEVKSGRFSRARTENLSPVSSRYGYSKLNRETVQDFEKKFQNTHVYRSVTGLVCERPSDSVSCKDNHVKALTHSKGHADVTKVVCADDQRTKKRCPSCGNNSDAGGGHSGGGRRCADCGGPIDKCSSTDSADEGVGGATRRCCSHCGVLHDVRGCTVQCCVHCGGECCAGRARGRVTDEKLVSGQGSSSGASAASGQVPSYRKVLKMFETKSKLMTAAASVSPPPRPSKQSGGRGVREVSRPASHFDRHRVPRSRPPTGDDEIEKAVDHRRPPPHHHHPRDVIIERRRPHTTQQHCRDTSDEDGDEVNDPHFNRSEQELFKNARLQWMARDQQKRPRHHQQQGRGGTATMRGVTRGKLPPPSSKTQDSANGK